MILFSSSSKFCCCCFDAVIFGDLIAVTFGGCNRCLGDKGVFANLDQDLFVVEFVVAEEEEFVWIPLFGGDDMLLIINSSWLLVVLMLLDEAAVDDEDADEVVDVVRSL